MKSFLKKNSDRLFFAFLIILLVGVNIVLTKRVHRYQNTVAVQDTIIRELGISSAQSGHLENCFTHAIRYDGLKADGIELTDTAGRTFPISEIVRNGPVLILRHQERNCTDCTNFCLSKIYRFVEEYHVEPVIVSGYDDLYRLKKDARTSSLKCYNAAEVTVADKLNAPYCFILNKDLTVTALYVPEKSIPSAANRYLRNVYSRYFQKAPQE